MKDLYNKIFQPIFMDMQVGWFKDVILRDCMELESQVNNFKLKYGLELEITVKIPEPVEGRYYGKGIVDKLNNLTK